jgi:hypothetical protein
MDDNRYTAKVEVLMFDKVRLAETATSTTCVVMNAHGCQKNDFIYNFSRATNPPIYYTGETARRKIIDVSTTSKFYIGSAISGQVKDDVIFLYKFSDITQYLRDESLNISLQAQGENNASFKLKTTYEPGGEFLAFHGWDDSYFYDDTTGFNFPRKTWTSYNTNGVATVRNSAEGSHPNVYVMHGETGAAYLDTNDEFNITNNAWTSKTGDTITRTACYSSYIDNYVYMAGGVDGVGYYDDLTQYNPVGDSWVVKAVSDGCASGDGLNLAGCLFLAYGKGDIGGSDILNTIDIFYVPYNNTWLNYPVDHSDPDRCFCRSGFTIDGFKGNLLGGSSDLGGDPIYALDNNTLINFPCKTYTEKNGMPSQGQELYSAQYEQYAIIAGGVYGDEFTAGSYTKAAYAWNEAADTWAVLEDFPHAISGGCATTI